MALTLIVTQTVTRWHFKRGFNMNTRSLYWLIYMSICCCAGWAQAEGVPVLYGDDRSLSERDQSRLVMNHTVVALGQFLQLPNEHANENLGMARLFRTIYKQLLATSLHI